jgi:hypothetical protein
LNKVRGRERLLAKKRYQQLSAIHVDAEDDCLPLGSEIGR